jgi:nucleotide-binding universal stress UspA family protein
MFRTAIVGLDLSPAQDALLSCLPALERWGVSRIVLVHVIRIGFGQGAGYGHEQEFRDWLEGCAEPLRSAGLEVEVVVTDSGSVGRTLVDFARERDADLLVVGSRSHNLLRTAFLGSVAREVARQADLPVLVQRIEAEPGTDPQACLAVCHETLDRVLLATDFSEHSAPAEAAALALAPRAGRIDCLHVGAASNSEAVQRTRALADRLARAGTRAVARVETGEPEEVIAQVGQEGYTLIVMGKFGRGRIQSALIGSTAARVCEAAGIPVLLVPMRRER